MTNSSPNLAAGDTLRFKTAPSRCLMHLTSGFPSHSLWRKEPSGCPAGCRLHVPWGFITNALFVICLAEAALPRECPMLTMPKSWFWSPHTNHQPTYLPIYPPTHPPVSQSSHPSIHLYTNLHIHSFHHSTIHSSTYQPNTFHLPANTSMHPARQRTLNEYLLAIHVFINLPSKHSLAATINSSIHPTNMQKELNISFIYSAVSTYYLCIHLIVIGRHPFLHEFNKHLCNHYSASHPAS